MNPFVPAKSLGAGSLEELARVPQDQKKPARESVAQAATNPCDNGQVAA